MAARASVTTAAGACLVALSACSDNGQSTLHPGGPGAEQIADLWWIMLAAATVIFLVVMVTLTRGLTHRGHRAEPHSRDHTTAPTRWVVAGGVVLPTVVLMPLLVLTLHALARLHAARRGRCSRDRHHRSPVVVECAVQLRQPCWRAPQRERDSHPGWAPGSHSAALQRRDSQLLGSRAPGEARSSARPGEYDLASGGFSRGISGGMRRILRPAAHAHAVSCGGTAAIRIRCLAGGATEACRSANRLDRPGRTSGVHVLRLLLLPYDPRHGSPRNRRA